MVIVDTDHPDIEDFIDWKVIEEQKVAALVAGSRLCNKHLNLVMAACREEAEDPFDPAKNPALKREIRAARRVLVSENYIQRVIQLARQGHETIDFRTYDTDWDSEAYLTVAGQEFQQHGAHHQRVPRRGRRRRRLAQRRRTDGKVAKTVPARALWDRIAFAAWASADPGVQFDTTINDWHTCPDGGRIAPRTRAPNTCSSTTRRAISPRST